MKENDEQNGFVSKTITLATIDSPYISHELFGLVSRKSWLDCLLQILKVCVMNRITPKHFKASPVPYNTNGDAYFPDVNIDPLISNIYSVGERILLTWLNYCYANYKERIWGQVSSLNGGERGGVPATRWIVNFDVDLTDSLVLAATIGAYCPFVVSRMFLFLIFYHIYYIYIEGQKQCAY